jgi:23S rRNA (guanosine2251-2'-O)-methyltransferase
MRSTHNVGSLLRTADGLGVQKVYFTGYTPFPAKDNDPRLPHEAAKITKQIQKTALGAEKTVDWQPDPDINELINHLRKEGFVVAALEQTSEAKQLPDYHPPTKLAIITGREVEGLEKEVIAVCDTTLEIPMFGQKESFNVVQAAAIALYHCRFHD